MELFQLKGLWQKQKTTFLHNTNDTYYFKKVKYPLHKNKEIGKQIQIFTKENIVNDCKNCNNISFKDFAYNIVFIQEYKHIYMFISSLNLVNQHDQRVSGTPWFH
jgi:hypothetical protein